jgi:ribosome-associated protein
MTEVDSWEKVFLCAQSALDKKAYDLVILEVRHLTTIADYFLICTGRSDTQVQSICRAIEETLDKQGMPPLAIEGYTRGQWVLMDHGDVIVHIFYQPVRLFYDLEGLWFQARRCQLPEPYHTQAQHLSTGTADS